ncbi:hypothetical protein FRB95_007759 [Tulasnella sp. JGI-2019a]|nr:hypothetical protein FRB95_007759 [Tulasnella sp. JGI-2019a]
MIAAAVDTSCPYQTAVSTVLRDIVGEFLQRSYPAIAALRRLRVRHAVTPLLLEKIATNTRRMCKFLGRDSLWRLLIHSNPMLRQEETSDMKSERICAHSILWMLENATEEEILTCADNIPALSNLSSTRIVSQCPLFFTLVQRFEAALADVFHNHDATEGSTQSLLILGRAVVHVVTADPTRWASTVTRALNANGGHRIASLYFGDGPGDIWALCGAAYLATTSNSDKNPDHLRDDAMDQAAYVIGGMVEILPSSQPSTTLAFLSTMKLSRYGIPFHVIDPSIGYQNSVVNLLCLEVIDLAEGSRRPLDQRVRDVWLARNGTNVLEYISRTIEAHDRRILEGVDRRDLLRYHTRVLQYYRSSHPPSIRRLYSNTASGIIIKHLSHVIMYCHAAPEDQTTSSPWPTHTSAASLGNWQGQLLWTLARDDRSWEERLSSDMLVPAETL